MSCFCFCFFETCNSVKTYRVKIENMRGQSACGMEVREALPKITEREGANCKKENVFWWNSCAKVLRQKTGGLRN